MKWFLLLLRRLGAAFIDYSLFVQLTIFSIYSMEVTNFKSEGLLTGVYIIGALLISFIWFSLFAFKDLYNGISPGRWLMGMAVRNQSDHKLPDRRVLFLRNLYLLSGPFELVELVSNKFQLRRADKDFKTVVIKLTNPKFRILRIIALIVFIAFYTWFPYLMGEMK